MRLLAKTLAVLTTVFVLFLVTPFTASAAEGVPGDTVELVFGSKNCSGIQINEFRYSDRSAFSSVAVGFDDSGSLSGIADENGALVGTSELSADIFLTMRLTIAPDAAPGNYTVTAEGLKSVNWDDEEYSESHTVTVKAKPAPPSPSEESSSQMPTQPGESESEVTVDYTRLTRQIQIASGITNENYTTATWNAFRSALSEAKAALRSEDQATVDNKASALQAAMNALGKVDYSELQTVIESTDDFLKNEALVTEFETLREQLERSSKALDSGSQEEVNSAAAELKTLLQGLEKKLDDYRNKPVIEVEKKVEIEVPPTDDYCNVRRHNLWPILFFVSLGLNLAVAAFIVYIVIRRKKVENDDTPLVDYDIDDDSMDR